jgi:hypothetical protein
VSIGVTLLPTVVDGDLSAAPPVLLITGEPDLPRRGMKTATR